MIKSSYGIRNSNLILGLILLPTLRKLDNPQRKLVLYWSIVTPIILIRRLEASNDSTETDVKVGYVV